MKVVYHPAHQDHAGEAILNESVSPADFMMLEHTVAKLGVSALEHDNDALNGFYKAT